MELANEETIKKLESIFMPHMAKSKKNFFKKKHQYIHYTSAENAINILRSETIWMRNPTCMNDYMEISHGHQLLLKFFQNAEHRNKFENAINKYEEGISEKILKRFDEWWEKIRLDTFITSISVHLPDESQHGRLSMWRAYGNEGGKAGLVINNPTKSNKNLGVILSPVAYFTYEDLEHELLGIINSINENINYLKTLKPDTVLGTVIITLILLAVCLKHPGFKEEQEWRLIYLPAMFPHNNWVKRSIETINGIPQVVYKLPLKNSAELGFTGLGIPEIIDKVLIGPTQYPLAMFDAFCDTLEDLGVTDASSRIIISNIPLRT